MKKSSLLATKWATEQLRISKEGNRRVADSFRLKLKEYQTSMREKIMVKQLECWIKLNQSRELENNLI